MVNRTSPEKGKHELVPQQEHKDNAMPESKRRVPLPGSERAALPSARPVGAADPAARIEVTVVVRPRAAGEDVAAAALSARLPHERQYLSRAELATARGADPDDLAKVTDFARARVVLGQGRPAEALERLAPLLEQVRTAERWGDAIESLVLQARAYQTRHDDRQALAALAEAVRLAEPAGYIRIFADEGGPMAALLAQLRDQERRRGPTPYLDTLLAAFPRHRQETGRAGDQDLINLSRAVSVSPGLRVSQTLVEPLSARELEVLHLMARGGSNQEIAEELVLALNTVKRHVSNIIAKLGAANRTQAVAQGRALGLLADEPSVGSRLLAVAV